MLLKRLAQIEFAVAALLLATIVLLVFSAAIMRFFGHPLIWSVDMAQLLFIWLCFFGATRAMRNKAHLGIDLLVRHLPRRARYWLEMALSVLFLIFLALLTVEGISLTLLNLPRQFGDSGFQLCLGHRGGAGRLRHARHRARVQHGARLAGEARR